MKDDAFGDLKKAVLSLLKAKLSEKEEQELSEEGFDLKRPTRTAAVAIALYKKAVKGDLSAIKELNGLIKAEGGAGKEGAKVKIIDDIGD